LASGNPCSRSFLPVDASFDSLIRPGATINSVTVSVEWKVSTTASIATLGAGAWVNGAAYGSELVTSAEPTTDTTQSFAVSGLSRAQLLNGVFGVRVRASRGNSNTAFTASLDAVSVAVTYTASGGQSVTVTAVGVTTARGADGFGYDQANRLTQATVAGLTETSTYDGDGVRATRQVGAGPLTRYVTDPAAGLPVTLDDGTRRYVWGLGLAYAVSGTAIEVYHADRLGSVRALTDAGGSVIATYRSDEFGIPLSATGSSTQPFRYTGEPLDASGLTYLRARLYDPSIGRFMTRDAFGGDSAAVVSLHRYSYMGNRPTVFADPTGHCFGPAIALAPICIEIAKSAVIGVVSYVGSTVAANVITNVGEGRHPLDDPARGLNPLDAFVSGVAGVLGGPIGALTSAPLRIASGTALGCTVTFASQAPGGRAEDLLETAIGCISGAAGSVLKLSSQAASVVYGGVVAVAQASRPTPNSASGNRHPQSRDLDRE